MFEPVFIDRLLEIEALRSLSYRGTYLPVYIYGPEGCGKSRLLKEFIESFDGVAIYIDALEARDPRKAVRLNSSLRIGYEAIKSIASTVSGDIGRFLAERIVEILEGLSAKISFSGRNIVIAIDDVTRSIGVEKVEWYLKWLYEQSKRIYRELTPKSVAIIATTSEGLSLRSIIKHTYTNIKLIWNLSYKSLRELAIQLDPPNDEIIDELWMATGGNPRSLLEIAFDYSWNIRSWKRDLENRLITISSTIKSKGLKKEVIEIIEVPDTPIDNPTSRFEEAVDILIDGNLIIYKGFKTIHGHEVSANPDLGIGRYYAWQIPAKREILKSLLE